MLYDKTFIQVLWVEDNVSIHDSFTLRAENFNIQLVPVECWEEAEPLLENDYQRWQAIILDAKCKYKKTDKDDPKTFLSHALDRIKDMSYRKGHTIPWYVLSGQAEDDIRDLIPPSRLDWDADWDSTVNRPYYDKSKSIAWGGKDENGNDKTLEEYKVLFHRIRAHVLNSNVALSLRVDLYPEVFKAIDDLKLPGEVEQYIVDLLGPIHFKGTKDNDYNHRYSDVRKLLEHIFRDMIERGILPTAYRGSKKKKEINLSWSCEYLGKENKDFAEGNSSYPGIEHYDKKKQLKIRRNIGPLLPIQLADMLKITVFQCGGAVHTSESEAEIQLNLDKYLPHVNQSPCMLRAISLAMADFIVWYRNYAQSHNDAERNALDWDVETY